MEAGRCEVCCRKARYMASAFTLSILAAFIIEYLLLVAYSRGAPTTFSPPASHLFLPLVFIATLVWHSLRGFVVAARTPTNLLLPPGIAGAFVAYLLTLASPGSTLPMVLISTVYLAELAVGVKLYHDIKDTSRLGAILFVAGMAAFILSLPPVIIDSRVAIIPLAANLAKTAGLTLLLARTLAYMKAKC